MCPTWSIWSLWSQFSCQINLRQYIVSRRYSTRGTLVCNNSLSPSTHTHINSSIRPIASHVVQERNRKINLHTLPFHTRPWPVAMSFHIVYICTCTNLLLITPFQDSFSLTKWHTKDAYTRRTPPLTYKQQHQQHQLAGGRGRMKLLVRAGAGSTVRGEWEAVGQIQKTSPPTCPPMIPSGGTVGAIIKRKGKSEKTPNAGTIPGPRSVWFPHALSSRTRLPLAEGARQARA